MSKAAAPAPAAAAADTAAGAAPAPVAPTMIAVGYTATGAAADVFKLVQLPVPTPGPRDLLVRVLSIATNPVDTKLRSGAIKLGPSDGKTVTVVGWDCVGVVAATGADAKSFAVGDRVYFAGVFTRAGAYAEYTCVDERIVAKAPAKLANDDAATIPLVALTAWESLAELAHLQVPATDAERKQLHAAKTMLIIAGAGGVGSLAIQLAKRVFGIGKVVASSSRPETDAWCKAMGADATVNHKQPMAPQLAALGLVDGSGAGGVDIVCNFAENYTEAIACVRPFGALVSVGCPPAQDFTPLFMKRATAAFELMFARAMHGVEMEKQSAILATLAALFDAGVLKSTLKKQFDGLTVANVVAAQQLQESGTAIGKIAITVAAK